MRFKTSATREVDERGADNGLNCGEKSFGSGCVHEKNYKPRNSSITIGVMVQRGVADVILASGRSEGST